MQGKADLALGYAATGVGTSGAAVQLWGDVGSLLVVALNLLLACGGLYLIAIRIRKTHRDIADSERERAERSNPSAE